MNLHDLPLGQKTAYVDQYDPSLLYSIARAVSHNKILAELGLEYYDFAALKGFDIWNCYEFSWLNTKQKPQVRILEFLVPSSSENIVESKSVKLYLNSFHNTKFTDEAEVLALVTKDLSNAVGAEVYVRSKILDAYNGTILSDFEGITIDDLDIEITDFSANSTLLSTTPGGSVVSEVLRSNLLKANCLVTNQPDWGAVQMSYTGKQIDHASLLRYIISFRTHNEFAEPWVERAFMDIMRQCAPESLTIHTRFTRRGGIDINPIRSTQNLNVTDIKNFRHVRQ